MQSEFLKYDQEKIIERFHLDADDEFLRFPFFGSECRVNRKNGMVACAEDGIFREGDFNESLTVYDLLCRAKPEAAPSGEYVLTQSLSPLQTSAAGLGGNGFYTKEALFFDHHTDELNTALRTLHGCMTKGGDVSAFIPVFHGLQVLFRFWNSDDEFSPQIQIFWDKNILQYMHYETVWYACGVLISRIRNEMKRLTVRRAASTWIPGDDAWYLEKGVHRSV